MKIEIKAWVDGRVLFAADTENNTVADTLLMAIKAGVDLWGVDLSDSDLRGANLMDASLRRSDLSRANLINAALNGADLMNASLSDACLIDTDFHAAYLRGADLSGAIRLLSLASAQQRIRYGLEGHEREIYHRMD